jgi:hypothetical protein
MLPFYRDQGFTGIRDLQGSGIYRDQGFTGIRGQGSGVRCRSSGNWVRERADKEQGSRTCHWGRDALDLDATKEGYQAAKVSWY